MTEFKAFLNRKIEKLFLRVWPPFGEEDEASMDISFGFIFQNEEMKLYVISVDKDDLWSPQVLVQSQPTTYYYYEDFHRRKKMWMDADDDFNLPIENEYYDVTKAEIFSDIAGHSIEAIDLLMIDGNPEPFGVKISFEQDYILSLPNSDGNTVQTSMFNTNNGIESFQSLGDIIYSSI